MARSIRDYEASDAFRRAKTTSIREQIQNPILSQTSGKTTYTAISGTSLTTISKRYVAKSMLICNTGTVDTQVTLYLNRPGGSPDHTAILFKTWLPIGTSIVLNSSELAFDDTEEANADVMNYYSIKLDVAAGTPTIDITTRI